MMEANLDYQYFKRHIIFLANQAEDLFDRLSVDVVALYVPEGDGSAKELSDFVFQDLRQTLVIADDESARNAAVASPTSVDLRQRGQFAPIQDPEAQRGTDSEAAPTLQTPHLKPSPQLSRRSAMAERKVNWLTDGNGQTIRKAMQPLHISSIIGIGFKPAFISDFAQPAKDLVDALMEVWQDCNGRSIVFLCHGYGAFLLTNLLKADQNQDLRQAIAVIGLFGIDRNGDISELRKWTAERFKMNTQSFFTQDCQTDFWKALDNLREDHFVSTFTFHTKASAGGKTEGSKTSSQGLQINSYHNLDRDPVWDGGSFGQIATFAGPDDARFRNMCSHLIESVDGHQLLTAARKNQKDVIMEVIRRGANVDSINYTSRDNKTALAIAAEAGHVETVRFLSTKDYVNLDHGVDIEKSALHCALQFIKDRRGEIDEHMENESDQPAPWSGAKQVVKRLQQDKRLPPEEELRYLDDRDEFDGLVKKLVRIIKVVEILLEAGALPTEGLVNTIDTKNPFEKVAKELLSNPPAVQGPSPRGLFVSSPSQDALHVCRKTPFVIREVFSAGKNGKDRYIPLYTDIEQVIYQGGSSKYKIQPGQDTGLSSNVPSTKGPGLKPAIMIQTDKTPPNLSGPTSNTLATSKSPIPDIDSEFDMDKEFSRRGENSKDADSQLLCRWYHIPMNNMAWDLFARLGVHVWPWPQGYRDYKPRSRAVYPQFVKPKPLATNVKGPSLIVHAIMIPYLSYESNIRQTLVTEAVDSRSSSPADEYSDPDEAAESLWKTHGDRWMDRLAAFSRPTPNALLTNTKAHFDFSDIYKRYQNGVRERLKRHLSTASDLVTLGCDARELTNAYLDYKHNSGYKLPLHPRRTLDQSHYYMLRDTTYRDRTQVVSRWFRRNRRGQRSHQNREYPAFHVRADQAPFEEENHNILMVDQLWIWLIKENGDMHETDVSQGKVTLVTSFPERVGIKSAAHDNIAQQVFRDSTRGPFHSVSDLVRQIITVCLRTLNEGRVDGSVTFLQCFEISLGNLEDRSAQSFLEFRRLSEFLEHLDEKHPDYLSRRGLLLKMLLRISKDSKILAEAKDVLDEIRMVQGVLQDQEGVLNEVLNDKDREIEHLLGVEKDRMPLHNELRRMVATFEHMKQRAQSVVESIERLLDMKQKQANLWEARTSREGFELAAKAGNTLWWFTAVTIIFLPLSFMASFFALDVDKFPKDDDGDTNWPLELVVGILFGISLAIIIPLYALAFFSENLQRAWSMIRGVWMPLTALPILWALNMIPSWRLNLFTNNHSRNKLHTVKRYDPKFEQNIERMMGENGTEVIEDDDLDEEDDLIRLWRMYTNGREEVDINDDEYIFLTEMIQKVAKVFLR